MEQDKLIRFQFPSCYCSQRHTVASINALLPAKHDSKPLYNKVTDLLMGIKPGLNRERSSWPLTVALGSSNQLKLRS